MPTSPESKVELNAPEVPAPPSTDPSPKSKTDITAPRDVDSESARPRLEDVAANKKRSKTAPKSTISQTAPAATPVNDLRLAVQSSPLVMIQRPEPNWFLPSCAFLMHVVHIMNDKIIELRPFGDRGSVQTWCPFTSILYFSVLFIVQTLRAQELAGLITAEQLLFLQQFTTVFKLESLCIPGPLVAFFRSISIASPGLGTYHDVLPAIPNIMLSEAECWWLRTAIPDNATRGSSGAHLMIPHIRLILDQYYAALTWTLTPDTNTNKYNYSNWVLFSRIFGIQYSTATTSLGNAPGVILQLMPRNPALIRRPNMSDGLLNRHSEFVQNFVHYFPTNWTIDPTHKGDGSTTPVTPPSWETKNSFTDFMGFTSGYSWFGVIIQGMQEFCNHWNGNTNLLALSPTSSTSGMLLQSGISLSRLPATPAFGRTSLTKADRIFTFSVSTKNVNPYHVQEDIDDARVALINVEHAADSPLEAYRPGGKGETRFGSYWDIAPTLSESKQEDLTTPVLNAITSPAFFNARGIN